MKRTQVLALIGFLLVICGPAYAGGADTYSGSHDVDSLSQWVGVACIYLYAVVSAYRKQKAQTRNWRKLSAVYATVERFDGRIELEWLKVGTNNEGIYLSVRSFVYGGSPGVFIPWEDVIVTDRNSRLLGKGVELQFRKEPDVTIWLSGWRLVGNQASA